MNPLTRNIVEVCSVLNRHQVKYLIIGGIAVALYGYLRISKDESGLAAPKQDIDFWYSPDYYNYFNLLRALGDLGQDVSAFMAEKTPQPRKSFFKLTFDAFTLDFLPEIPGLTSFPKSYEKRNQVELEGCLLSIISIEDLLVNKKITGREKDLEDLGNL